MCISNENWNVCAEELAIRLEFVANKHWQKRRIRFLPCAPVFQKNSTCSCVASELAIVRRSNPSLFSQSSQPTIIFTKYCEFFWKYHHPQLRSIPDLSLKVFREESYRLRTLEFWKSLASYSWEALAWLRFEGNHFIATLARFIEVFYAKSISWAEVHGLRPVVYHSSERLNFRRSSAVV